jgi:hypothetical protein
MSLMNILTHINIYEDNGATSNPSKNVVKWTKDVQGVEVNEPSSKNVKINAGESLDLFSNSISSSADATTTWDIALKAGTSNTYVISHNAGTAPVFKTLRSIGSDATTEVAVTKNATILKFQATDGTIWDLVGASVQVGDIVRIGDGFNALNQGKFSILTVDTDSFTVENQNGAAESIVLGATFADQVKIHSTAGIQVGYKVDLQDGFSPVTLGAYEITDVADDYIEVYSPKALPAETGVSNDPEAMLFYKDAKKFVYIESDKKIALKVNSSSETNTVEPIIVGGSAKNGIFLSISSIKTLEVVNKTQETANVFFVTAE